MRHFVSSDTEGDAETRDICRGNYTGNRGTREGVRVISPPHRRSILVLVRKNIRKGQQKRRQVTE